MRLQHHRDSLCVVSAMAALVTSCAAPQQLLNPPVSAQLVRPFSGYWNYAIVRKFQNPSGKSPFSGVLVYKGNLYGTLAYGGMSSGKRSQGTIYEVAPDGREHILHYFMPGPSGAGAHPYGGLTEFNGRLYGTTAFGGNESRSGGYGTIFSISPSGTGFQTLHQFEGTDGGHPTTNLTVLNGTLYGTTDGFGANHVGTVFAVTSSGGFKKLYDFAGGKDGANPSGPLAALNGKLYGTTILGGTSSAGTVFSITAGGSERVLYSCRATPDCAEPLGGVTPLDGKLYGNSLEGGSGGGGSVFAVTTAGEEQVLYSFPGSDHGDGPDASLAARDGTLYGSTDQGGDYQGGIVFSITPKGSFRAIYHLTSRFAEETSTLTYFGGKFYGTLRYGVLYSLTP